MRTSKVVPSGSTKPKTVVRVAEVVEEATDPPTVVEVEPLPVTSEVEVAEVEVGEAAEAEARRVAVVVAVGMTSTTATESFKVVSTTFPWQGGRDGHVVYEDDWAPDRSWSYHKRVYPLCAHDPNQWQCPKCERAFRVYLKLHIAGSAKGKLVPVKAGASLGFSWERYRELEVPLGNTPVTTIREAKSWASKLATPSAIKTLFQTYYQSFELTPSKKGVLIEAFVKDQGWVEWLWSFEKYPHWMDLMRDYRLFRYKSEFHDSYTIVEGNSSGYSTTSWPSFWQRIRDRGEHWSRVTKDEFGTF